MFDYADLRRHDLELLADFLTNAVFTVTAGADQFVLGQFVDDFDARKIGRQRLGLATTSGWSYDLFFNGLVRQFNLVLGVVEQRHLGSLRVDHLFRFSTEQPLP
ncbi:hypothetical protein AO386_22675 [Pseudomonas syringae ICMP 11292]|nr:hypothetical protein AO386_22675 [Pseudomonas syringae ICMP 11292]